MTTQLLRIVLQNFCPPIQSPVFRRVCFWRRNGFKDSHLSTVAKGDHVIQESHALSVRAAEVGFDWETVADAFEKVNEELLELQEVLIQERPHEDLAKISEELGDLLFSIINVARKSGVDAESALRNTNEKFRTRFRSIENQLALRNITLEEAPLELMERFWQDAKESQPE